MAESQIFIGPISFGRYFGETTVWSGNRLTVKAPKACFEVPPVPESRWPVFRSRSF